MRTTYRPRCARRAPSDLEAWARSLIANPAAHGATERDAVIVGKLLAQLDGAR